MKRRSNLADLICFGRPFIGNPDFVERLRRGAKLTDVPRTPTYGGDVHGYTDWPTMEQEAAQAVG